MSEYPDTVPPVPIKTKNVQGECYIQLSGVIDYFYRQGLDLVGEAFQQSLDFWKIEVGMLSDEQL